MRTKYSLFFLCFLSFSMAFGQDTLPKFGAPLDIPLYLSGNFAELRRNHFHTGIDIKTQGVEGQNVLAAEDGVISRINVSPWGYGLALYIDHPNGYTTVYGHLSAYSKKIEEAARKKQYQEKAFSVDFTPDPPIQVKRGEIIALSGNSGGSGGPHLHFEIRKTEKERPQNPLLFGFDIKDDIAPRIRGVRFHPLADTTLINDKHEAQSFVVTGGAGKYNLKAGQNISTYGAFGLSLHTLDFLNGYPNRCGIYTLAVKVDNELICAQKFDELDFSTVRNINIYKDYVVYKNNNWHYHKSFIEAGNKLEIYDPATLNQGVIDIKKPGKHTIDYTTSDAYGNDSELKFDFTVLAKPNVQVPTQEPYDAYFPYGQVNHFEYTDELGITFPENALYSDLRFQFSRQMKTGETYSPIYLIQNEDVPLQEAFELKFSLKGVPKKVQNRILVQRSDLSGRTSYITGMLDKEVFVVESKDFGKFTLVADTVAPSLSAKKWSAGGTVSNSTQLQFIVGDNRSGVAAYNGYLNGEWVLVKYEPKKRMIYLDVADSNFPKGENILVIKLEDAVGNKTEESFKYNY